ncbi:MAG: ATP-binding protein [Smithellaceae bacterium]
MINRTIEQVLLDLAKQYPVVTITGPRQSGKTTLCRKVFPDLKYVNLEAPDTRAFAIEDPRGFLAANRGGVIIDEIQRAPDLLSYIQTIVDNEATPGQFILTGSQQLEVMNNISQSLAGRTALLKLLPLSLSELKLMPSASIDHLLFTGFYPRIHDKALNPTQALGDYLETYVERDLRQLAMVKDLSLFERFLKLCAGRVGQVLNIQSLGNDAGISHTTARSWLTLLEASYIIVLLQPWHVNISKRLIKSPKLYFCDVGLAAYLLGLEQESQVTRDPLRGNLFENMMVMEALKYRYNRGLRSNIFFYRENSGNEVDLIIENGRQLYAVEIKVGTTVNPDFFRGLKHFSHTVGDNWEVTGCVIYGGDEIQKRSPFPRLSGKFVGRFIRYQSLKYNIRPLFAGRATP